MGLTIFLLIVLIVSVVFPRRIELDGTTHKLGTIKAIAVLLSVLGVLISVAYASYYQVPAGTRGVLLQFGAVRGVLSEGPHFIAPYAQDVFLLPVQTQKSEASAAAASQDLQTVNTDIAINYHLDPGSVGLLYKNVGTDYEGRVIDPAVQEVLKAVVAQYTAEQLIRERALVKSQVDIGITQRLAPYHLIVETNGISLTNFQFSDQFNQAIEAKQVAEQTAEQQKYVLQQAQLAAQTAVATAEGEAKSTQIRAAALQAQGGSKVLAQAWIAKWNGQVPTVQSGTGGMMLNLNDFNGKG